MLHVNNRITVTFRYGVHLAAFNTGSTIVAGHWVYDGKIIGVCDRIFQAEISDTAQDAAAATAAGFFAPPFLALSSTILKRSPLPKRGIL